VNALKPQPGILEISPYIGGESALEGQDEVIKLSSNEGPFGASPAARDAYRTIVDDIHRYPDGGAHELRRTIGEINALDPGRIVCGAGSDELISLLCQAYAGVGDEILHSQYGFLMYPIAARTVGAIPISAPEADLTADVDALLAAVTDKTRILFLANPNNPTGTYLPADEVARLRRKLADDVLLVIDAAYAEYVSKADYESGVALVDAYDNVVMTRTFSKIYGLGGLRLGWLYGPPGVVDVLNRVRGPFNVGAASLAAGAAAMRDEVFTEKSRLHNDKWLAWTRERLIGLGLGVTDSVGNFLLVCFGDDSERGADAADAFLKDNGIIVRRMASYGLPNCLRITIGLEDEMRAVVDALGRFMGRNE